MHDVAPKEPIPRQTSHDAAVQQTRKAQQALDELQKQKTNPGPYPPGDADTF